MKIPNYPNYNYKGDSSYIFNAFNPQLSSCCAGRHHFIKYVCLDVEKKVEWCLSEALGKNRYSEKILVLGSLRFS